MPYGKSNAVVGYRLINGNVPFIVSSKSEEIFLTESDSMALNILAFLLMLSSSAVLAYDLLDPTANITINWDIMSWTPDGYVAVVTMNNFQMYRQITSPGWTLGWTWSKKEVVWSMFGAQATDQGDCKEFQNDIPYCCQKSPIVVDLHPDAPYNQQISNCCKGGIMASRGQDPNDSVSAFQLTVGNSAHTHRTVTSPQKFTLLGPGRGYTCSPAVALPSSVFPSLGGRRRTRALMTWRVTCTYSQMLASTNPTCCVSMSSFYNDAITPCSSCSCGCQNENNCPLSESNIASVAGVQCTHHMCPVSVHWHVKMNYKEYWRVRITITNFKYQYNYTKWTLVAQHPNLNDITRLNSFDYMPLLPYKSINDTGMFYGKHKFENDVLLEAGPGGNVYSEIILRKDMKTFTLEQGWAFPRRVYFNGDECMMPFPDSYPSLPNSASAYRSALPILFGLFFLLLTIADQYL